MSFLRKIILFSFLILSILGGFSFAQGAINEKINYQGKLTDASGTMVADGAYDIVFKFYTVAGGGAATWTESWTNAALWTEASMTFTNDGCAAGIDKVAYTTGTNENSLAAGQSLWNTTKKESAVIQSVDTTNNWVCVYDTPSAWVTTDGATNRIYVKNGLFSVMLGSVSSLSAVNFNQTLYLGVTVGADSEMKPRKVIGAVPAAIEAKQLGGKTWAVPDAIGSTTPNTGAFTGLTSTGNTSLSSTAGSTFAFGNSTGAATLQSGGISSWTNTSGNLSISTSTSGTLGLTSAGALNLSAGAASTWTLPNVANALNFDSDTLTIDALNNRVGIGTAAPLGQLHLNKAAQPEFLMSDTRLAGNQLGRIVYDGGSAVTGGGWVFQKMTDAGGFSSNLFTIVQNTGYIGVGNINPTSLFSVGATSQFQVNSSGAIAAATGIVSSGNVDLSSLSAGGLVKAAATTGRLSIATGGTDFENPLTFSNGLTRTTNAVKLGGTLTASTDVPLGGFNMTFSGSGNFGIGTSTPGAKVTISSNASNLPAPDSGTVLHIANADASVSRIELDAFGNNPVFTFRRSNGTAASPTAVLQNEYIGTVAGFGYGATGYSSSGRAQIVFNASENWTDSAQGTFIAFRTTPIGSNTISEKMRIDSAGNVGIGTTTPAANLTVAQGTSGVGTVSNSAGGTTVTGVGTQFLNTFKVGDTITIGGQTVAISAIASDTSMTTAAITNANSGAAYTLVGGTRMVVQGNGRVGIGTTVPTSTLHLSATAPQLTFTDTTNSSNPGITNLSTLGINGTDPVLNFGFAAGEGASRHINYRINGTNILTIRGEGNVGIRTTSPKYTLDVQGDISSSTAVRDAISWVQNQGGIEKLKLAYNNGGLGGGATPGNITMQADHFSFFDSTTVNANSKGFTGSVFDGRYIYFVPYNNGAGFGQVTRYDTTGVFSAAGSWSVFDTTTVNANSKGFIGAVFDGRYVYLIPYIIDGVPHGQVTRYDTTASFTTAGSWSVFDTTTVNANSKGFIGAVFDGRYLYLIPLNNGAYFGQVTRYDTTASFTAGGSWSVFDTTTVNANSKGFGSAVFDGRYIYLVPYNNGAAFGQVTRYDTTASFTAGGSWSVFDTSTVNANSKGFFGGVFDGRYVYFTPFLNGTFHGQVTRYDTAGSFSAAGSWSVFDTTTVNANSKGFISGVFDGRYIYFTPYDNGAKFGQVTRYDTTASFTTAGSWSVFDTATVNANSKGLYGAVFDGRYIYFTPYDNGAKFGQVTRMLAWAGGIDSTTSLSKIARGGDLYIDSAGNVGIGTTVPGAKLDVLASSAVGIRSLSSAALGTGSGGGLLAVTPNIPTATDQRLATIALGGITTGTTYNYPARINAYSSQAWSATASGAYLSFLTTPNDSTTLAERMRITDAGKIGIGTTDPGDSKVKILAGDSGDMTLTLQENSATNNARFDLRRSQGSSTVPTIVASGNYAGAVRFSGYDGANYLVSSTIRGEIDGTPGTNDMPGRLVFLTTVDGASAATERMRIDNAGNIGIGTTAPAYRLDVQKDGDNAIVFATAYGASMAGSFYGASARGTQALPTASQLDDFLGVFGAKGYGTTAFPTWSKASIFMKAAENWTDAAQGTYMTFNTTATGGTTRTEKMRIDASGNVGIGATSISQLGAGGTPTVLQVHSAGSFGFLGLSTGLTASSSFTGALTFGTTGTSSSEKRSALIASSLTAESSTNVSGDLQFYTNNAGSITQKMVILASGNVGIGTASPGTELFAWGAGRTIESIKSTASDGGALEMYTSATDASGNYPGQVVFGATAQSDGNKRTAIIASQIVGSTATNRGGNLEFYTKADAGSLGMNMVILNNGDIGIGTSGPESKVQISGGGLCVGSDANCNTDNDTEGVVYSSSTAMTAYDVAENYPTKDATLVPAEVVTLDSSQNGPFVSRGKAGETILGVVSTAPAVLMGGFNGQEYKEEIQVAVALSGRVPVKVSLENGSIEAGDYLTSSSIAGTAAKAIEAGRVIGVALESYDSQETGNIMIFVNPHWYGGIITENGMLANQNGEEIVVALGQNQGFKDLVASTVREVLISLSGTVRAAGEWTFEKLTAKQICVEDVCVDRDQLKELIDKNKIQDPVIPAISSPAPALTPVPTLSFVPDSDPIISLTPDLIPVQIRYLRR